ncbi:Poly(A) RNA polymerase cid13 [Fulvia fulva]|nr:Poly(A) RNA polymerase cid13 [Fulvia fulva]
MAGLPNGTNRLDLSRPAVQSQASNSVPSTPFQKPRDLSRRFSRSPSPNRGLSNQSPHSVASEAIGGNGRAHRGAPVVCKFESGEEFRKRRMPYVDGGDQELSPPKKEPKKTLNPDERDKLSGDMRELYDRLLPSQESEERRTKLVPKLDRILNDEWPGNDIRVNVFGSSGNMLSSTDSDVDICITTTLKKLDPMHSLAALLHKHGMEKIVCRAAAKVPIVKAWDPELQLAIDINVNNPLALQNTRMIRTYVQLDDRVRPLAKIIKYWTKRRILNDAAYGGTISSYTWICMIINFLQRRKPPILPSLQKIVDRRRKNESGEESTFADDIDALKGFGDANKESLGELLFQFFRHYGYEFSYSTHVISVREGRLVERKEKGWAASDFHNKESRASICVEEPFTVDRNLGNSADIYAWHGIHTEIRRAFELLEDGLQLEKCCEQYVFPKEEKPIFQKPPPKPKPTLTRSASQSGQNNREPGTGRSRKANRNQSSQRAGGRRASSGASFSNQRIGLPFSPPMGAAHGDYFQARGTLHEQLAQQYQILQAQEKALMQQLAQQQHTQTQGRKGDPAGSGSPRPRPHMNGLPSPRIMDHPPQTAPLLPGYPYHYPARYPPPSPMSQARSREGTNTNPPSPALSAAMPALRRQVHRASLPDASASSIRSQSQPGRPMQHPLALQQQIHPGYDVTGALGAHYQSIRSASQMYQPGQPGLPMPFAPYSAGPYPGVPSMEHVGPKEYVGYYVSPQLGPQYAGAGQMQPPQMTLQNPPTRQRRVTPDLMPPLVNDRHSSRSPSPLGQARSYAVSGDRRSSQPLAMSIQSPGSMTHSIPTLPPIPALPAPVLPIAPAHVDTGGPLIVNGSTSSHLPQQIPRANGSSEVDHRAYHDPAPIIQQEEAYVPRPLPLRTNLDRSAPEQMLSMERRTTSPLQSPTCGTKPDRGLMLSPNGLTPHVNGVNGHLHESTSLSAAPLLSPVAELRTPSPTRSRGFDTYESPEANGGLFKAAKIANAKQVAKEVVNENQAPHEPFKHERQGSASIMAESRPSAATKESEPKSALQTVTNQSSWQQVPKKTHRKSKSMAGSKSANGFGGQPLPANESERKGG